VAVRSLAKSVEALLPSFLDAYGPPGRERGVRATLRRALRGAGSISEDVSGNLRLHRPGRGPKLLIVAPMDVPGVIVTRVEVSGLGRISLLGGRTAAEWIGATVRFEDGPDGLVGYERGKGGKDSPADPEADQLFVETGLKPKEASRRLPVGSVGAAQDRPARLGSLWCAANLDNRAGCAAVAAAVKAVRSPRYDLHVVFTAQSELGARGAQTSTFGVDPDWAVVVEVAHVDGKDASGIQLGQGPCLGLKEEGFVAHPEVLAKLRRAAKAARVPTQWIIRDTGSTDARHVRAARIGVPTGLVAIPARKSGGLSSLAHENDIARTADLMARLISAPDTKSKGART
jgi:endoglucanase